MNDLRIQASLTDNLSGPLNTITNALGQNKRAAENAKKGLQGLSSSVSSAQNSLTGLMSAFKSGNILSFGQNILGASTSLGGLTAALGTATGAASGLGSALSIALGPVGLISGAIAGLGALFVSAGKAASDFEPHLDSLQSLTGLDDSGIKEMGESAIDMSKQFGTAAGDIVDSFKLIGSQSPELLKNTDALKSVTEAANVLAKAGEIEVVDAAKAITGTMNQMGASASQAKDIINTLAAGAKEGSYEIADLNEVFSKAGTMAKSSGMNFTELTALVEAVGGKFSEASVLGTSLNSTLIALSVQGNDKFKPAVVGMQQALDNLAAAELSDQEMKDLVGASNVKLLKSMIDLKGEYTRLNGAITGTNAAYEMAANNTDNLEGTINKLKASWDALMLSFGQSALVQGLIKLLQVFMNSIKDCIDYVSDLIGEFPKLQGGIDILDILAKAVKALTIPFKVAWQIIAVSISAWITLFNNVVQTVQNVWKKLKQIMSNVGIFKPIQRALLKVIDWFKKMVEYVSGLWNRFKKTIGMDVKEIKAEAVKLDDIDSGKAADDVQEQVTKAVSSGKGAKVKVKAEAEPGSIDALKKRLSDLQKELTSKNLSIVNADQIKKQIDEIQRQIDNKEIELGIKAKPGTEEYVNEEISKIEKKLSRLDPKISLDNVEIQKLQLQKAELEDLKKEIQEGLKGIEVTVTGKQFKSDAKEGSLKYAQDKVSYYRTQMDYAVDDSDYQAWKKKYEEWKEKEKVLRIKVEADLSDAEKGSLKWFTEQKTKWQTQLEVSAYGTPEYKEAYDHIQELTKQEHKVRLQMEIDGMTDLEKAYTIMDGFHAIDGVVSSFDSLSKAIEENANAWDIFISLLETAESIIAAVNAVSEISNMLSGIAAGVKTTEAGANIAASAAEKEKMGTDIAAETATATATASNKALEVSFLDLASAMIFAAHASIPFAGVGIASGLISTMLSVQAATKAATLAMAAFESGGIVGGNSYHGDRLIARVNSGEMILNGRQQKNLFDAINEGAIGNGDKNRLYGEVKIKGSDLYIALDNYGKVQGRLGKRILK